jgi:hypothetical protein
MHLRKTITLLVFTILATLAEAQVFVRTNQIPVVHGTHVLKSAWAGGMQAPQFSEIDLNQDGRMDMVAFDRLDGVLMPFLNHGSPGVPDYHFAPSFSQFFPSSLHNWVLARDYDGDGLIDLFSGTAQGSNIQVYRNTSSPGNLQFTLVKNPIKSAYPTFLSLYSAANDLPSISDLDNDGDLDILVFHVGGGFVEWHRNTSREIHGHSDSLEFVVQSNCFGHFQEGQSGCDAVIGLPPCGIGQRLAQADFEPAKTNLHAGSTLLALDLDADQLQELLVGDISCTDFYLLHNGGTAQIASFDAYSRLFPSPVSAFEITNFPAAYFLDVDNDGLRDLLGAPNAVNSSENKRGVQWQKNIGTNAIPVFADQGYGFAQDEMIETGTASQPAFIDCNNDGLKDLLIGTFGPYDSTGNFVSGLVLYLNTGTNSAPAFSLYDEDFLNFSGNQALSNVTFPAPCAGDLDNDGDDDLLVGRNDGLILHFENTGLSGGIAQFTLRNTHFAGIDVGLNATPVLFDLDADNDLDLVVGNHRGFLSLWRNNGTPSNPLFALSTANWGGIKVNDASGQAFTNGYSKPCFANVDADAGIELLLGSVTGEVQVYDDPGIDSLAIFVRLPDFTLSKFGVYSAPAAALLNGQAPAVVVGTFGGGLALVEASSALEVEQIAQQGPRPEILCFPNPAQTSLDIQVNSLLSKGSIRVFNAAGQLVYESPKPGTGIRIEVGSWPRGIYLVLAQSGQVSAYSKVVLD